MKTSYRDIYEPEEHTGGHFGISYVDWLLKELEQTPDRQGMQYFVYRITERLEEPGPIKT